jgi:transposase
MRWLRVWHEEGATAAKPRGGDRHSARIEAHGAAILEAIERQVDITLIELAKVLEREHGERFAPSTIWRFIDRHGVSFQKNRARQRAGTVRRRRPACGLVRGAARP